MPTSFLSSVLIHLHFIFNSFSLSLFILVVRFLFEILRRLTTLVLMPTSIHHSGALEGKEEQCEKNITEDTTAQSKAIQTAGTVIYGSANIAVNHELRSLRAVHKTGLQTVRAAEDSGSYYHKTCHAVSSLHRLDESKDREKCPIRLEGCDKALRRRSLLALCEVTRSHSFTAWGADDRREWWERRTTSLLVCLCPPFEV